MIKVVYDRSDCKVTVEGHAHSGDPGHDLVCASASILAYTLASFVKNTHKAKQVKKPILKLEPGEAVVSCRPKRDSRLAVTLVFDALCGGYELLARNYPKNISYTIDN